MKAQPNQRLVRFLKAHGSLKACCVCEEPTCPGIKPRHQIQFTYTLPGGSTKEVTKQQAIILLQGMVNSLSLDSPLRQTTAPIILVGAASGKSQERTVTMKLERIPDELKSRNQWVCWKIQQRNGKETKPPVDPKTGQLIDVTNSEHWLSLDEARNYYETHADTIAGIGFVLADGITGVDLDDCRNAQTGEIQTWAQEIIELMDSYTEVSPSGTGIHTFVLGRKAGTECRKEDIEVYDANRFFTVTGNHLEGTPSTIEPRQEALNELHARIWGRVPRSTETDSDLTADDKRLINKVSKAQNGDKFRKLYDDGDTSDYGDNHSQADLALCGILAYWTQDEEQIDRIFRSSDLYREKWDEEHRSDGTTYGEMTIKKAIDNRTDTYGNKSHSTILMPFSAIDLMNEELPEARYAVEGLIPEGLTILAGKPKTGKSWLALDLCSTIAAGQPALGKIEVEQGRTLYLGLEDNKRRLKSRLDSLLQGKQAPELLGLLTEIPRLDQGGNRWLSDWLRSNPDCRLIVIDTLVKVKPQKKGGGSSYSYDDDYGVMGGLQELALTHNTALVVVHHTRKSGADHVFDEVSGTTGLTGSSDAILLMKSAGDNRATLYVTGRDVESQELALEFSKQYGTWTLLGDASQFNISESRREVLETLGKHGKPMSIKDICNQLVHRSYDSIRKMLKRLTQEGEVICIERGVYSLPSPPLCSPS